MSSSFSSFRLGAGLILSRFPRSHLHETSPSFPSPNHLPTSSIPIPSIRINVHLFRLHILSNNTQRIRIQRSSNSYPEKQSHRRTPRPFLLLSSTLLRPFEPSTKLCPLRTTSETTGKRRTKQLRSQEESVREGSRGGREEEGEGSGEGLDSSVDREGVWWEVCSGEYLVNQL